MLAELASQALTMLQEFRPVLDELERVPRLPPRVWEIILGGGMILLSLPLVAMMLAAWYFWPVWIWLYYQENRKEEEKQRSGQFEPDLDRLIRDRIAREVDQAMANLRAKTGQP